MNVNEPNDTTTPENFSLDFKHPLYARRFDLNKATNQMPPFYLASYITTFEPVSYTHLTLPTIHLV